MTEAFIYDAVRTPRGKGRSSGALACVTPVQLAATALAALPARHAFDTALVEDVVLGCVTQIDEQGANVGRIAALRAGYAQSTPGMTVNRFCASGLEACNLAAAMVMAGQAGIVVGGGVEQMSRVPMGSDGSAWAADPAVAHALGFVPQGISADLIATRHGYSRRDLDALALASQQRAARAWEERRFARAIVPVRDVNGLPVLDHDELVRPDTTIEGLAKLAPSFDAAGQKGGFDAIALRRYPDTERIEHVHTPGNSSGIVDGAAAVLIGHRDAGARLGLAPRARIRAFASVGSEPTIMLTGPSFAAERALAKAGMAPGDIDLFEVNEAFAAVVLRFIDALGIDPGRVNVNGGAIAMGHPLGATGAMLLGMALDELERSGRSTALVTLCVGAGMGTATIIERV